MLDSNTGTVPRTNIGIDTRPDIALRDEVLSGPYARMNNVMLRLKNDPPESCRNERAQKRQDTAHYIEHGADRWGISSK